MEQSMKCPHCRKSVFITLGEIMLRGKPDGEKTPLLIDKDSVAWEVRSALCPACKNAIIFLRGLETGSFSRGGVAYHLQVWPKGTTREPLSPLVPADFASDYQEACLVLNDSPKASAALGRRCLQYLLREKVGVRKGNLSNEIQKVLDTGGLPSDLAESIDAIRNIGNFAAHPMKSTNSGEILDVELGEAEWTLDVLEDLFDFYFIRPAVLAAKKEKMNQKLQEAGKPKMK